MNADNCCKFVKRSLIPYERSQLFEYHARAGAVKRLIAPWSGLDVISQSGGINDGAVTEFKLSIGPVKAKWVSKHFGYVQDQQFQDEMIKGPFKSWTHTHSFLPQDNNMSVIEDNIRYTPPFGKIGAILIQRKIQDYLNQLFLYRHQILINDTKIIKSTLDDEASKANKNILISGSHGLIGNALVPFLTAVGRYRITRLARSNISSETNKNSTSSNEGFIYWDIENEKVNLSELEGFDVIIHLAGENLFGRWSHTKKRSIFESRVKSTRFLCESLSKLSRPPGLLITASAIGYYGNRINESVTEDSNPGSGFLSELCQEWEQAASSITEIGVRVVNTRFGLVLSPLGGFLKNNVIHFVKILKRTHRNFQL